MHLILQNRLSEISRMTESLKEFCKPYGISEKECLQMTLVMDELLTNVIEYAKAQSDIVVTARMEGSDQVVLTICDDGQAFNPLKETQKPDLEAPLESRKIGGLGVHITLSIMDETHYQRELDQNKLILKKKVKPFS